MATYPHWQYFLTLDSDLQRLSRYIEIDAANYGVYSVELVRILLAASSEIDVVAKLLCSKLGTSLTKARGNWTIDNSREVILVAHSQLPTLAVTVPAHGISLLPWQDWQQGKNPAWWQSHNAVKHDRNTSYKDANLINTLNAVAGLFVLVAYLYEGELNDVGSIVRLNFFSLGVDYFPEVIWSGGGKLP